MDNLQLIHERVDNIPLVYGMLEKLQLAERLDNHLGNHGLHQGLSNGYLTVLWLLFVISEGDHRKSGVQDWVDRHQQTLERLMGQSLRGGN